MATTAAYTVVFPKAPTRIPPAPETKLPDFEEEWAQGVAVRDDFLEMERHLLFCAVADLIEENPQKTLAHARRYVEKFIDRKGGSQDYFKEWQRILERGSVAEICAMLRDKRRAYEGDGLLLCVPVFGPIPEPVLTRIYETLYDTAPLT